MISTLQYIFWWFQHVLGSFEMFQKVVRSFLGVLRALQYQYILVWVWNFGCYNGSQHVAVLLYWGYQHITLLLQGFLMGIWRQHSYMAIFVQLFNSMLCDCHLLLMSFSMVSTLLYVFKLLASLTCCVISFNMNSTLLIYYNQFRDFP